MKLNIISIIISMLLAYTSTAFASYHEPILSPLFFSSEDTSLLNHSTYDKDTMEDFWEDEYKQQEQIYTPSNIEIKKEEETKPEIYEELEIEFKQEPLQEYVDTTVQKSKPKPHRRARKSTLDKYRQISVNTAQNDVKVDNEISMPALRNLIRTLLIITNSNFTCSCGAEHDTEFQLDDHIIEQHNIQTSPKQNQQYKCPIAKCKIKVMPTVVELKEHMKQKHAKCRNDHKCKLCQRSFYKIIGVYDHILVMHEPEEIAKQFNQSDLESIFISKE